ncbi:MAG: hypothetical protein D4R55_00130 [Chitinophagaceae bacterium]|nr:MAG: hypothetical protein D4R55_00130 [Chitinophagaceae bacterium]
MERKIRVGAVSYLNTKPLIYGFEQGVMADEMELVLDYPAQVASMLIDDRIDLGLVPVATIPSLTEYHIVSDYGICCDGEVASVCLFSDVPLNQIKSIFLDYQSRSSVALLKLLLRDHWKISPVLVHATEGYEQQISRGAAGLVIGDRAFEQYNHSAFSYDLGLAWKEMTGLPFVFAAWISNKKLPDSFVQLFNKANQFGLDHLPEVISKANYSKFDLQAYYTRYIDYRFDEEKRKGLELFLKLINPAAV